MRVCVLVVLALTSATQAAPRADDFTRPARELFRIAACGNDSAVPEQYSRLTIDRHCTRMRRVYDHYRSTWVDAVKPFIAKLLPSDAPATVVYPFGGGDLSSALSVFPDATELTTLSLEAAGDVRAVDAIAARRLSADLEHIAKAIRRLYSAGHSTTLVLQQASHAKLPGTILFALAGLAVHDMEPTQLRYFDIEPDGTLRYLTPKELDERADQLAGKLRAKGAKVKHFWYAQTSAFANVEIQFRKRGDAKAPVRTYRHILANLDDTHLTGDGRVLAHLKAKGKVSVMTKAASFLLWWDDFSQVREYVMANAAWMISDASGIPPRFARKAGLEQITYGQFTGPYFVQDPNNERKELIKLWADQPVRELPFRFGYPDKQKHAHLMITRPKGSIHAEK